MIIKIPVVSICYDNGDGGYSIQLFNNNKELIENHRQKDDMTKELEEEILSGDNEYENGYLDSTIIEIDISDLNKVRLHIPVYIHAGQ